MPSRRHGPAAAAVTDPAPVPDPAAESDATDWDWGSCNRWALATISLLMAGEEVPF